jgi:ketosteroid isomerase-like protein
MAVKRNLKLMKMADDAWNDHDWDALGDCFDENVEVYWPDQLMAKKGPSEYVNGAKAFVKSYPDARIENDPYKVCFGGDDWTCTVALMSGTNTGSMMGPDGKAMPPTNKMFRSDFCTVARWKSNRIIELRIFYDMASMMRQLGLMPTSPTATERLERQKVRTVME